MLRKLKGTKKERPNGFESQQPNRPERLDEKEAFDEMKIKYKSRD
jgi:hypothetical protein